MQPVPSVLPLVSLIALGAAGAGAQAPAYVLEWGSSGGAPGQLSGHHGIEVAANGNVYVADTDNDRVQVFDANGALLFAFGSGGSGPGQFDTPHGLALGPNGDVYVAEHGGTPRVQRFQADGTYVLGWGTKGGGPGQFNHPHGVAVDADGEVFVAENPTQRIQKFDADGNFLLEWGSFGLEPGQFERPNGLDVDANGDVFVADNSGRVLKFDNDGNFLLEWGSTGAGPGQFDKPRGVAVDSTGRVLVTDRDNDRVQMFTNTGGFLAEWGSLGTGPGQFDGPYALDVGIDDAYVYVNDSGNDRVQKFCFAALVGTCDDCNANGEPDDQDVAGGVSADLDGNGVPDECDPLSADVATVPIGAGGTQALSLQAGAAQGGLLHLVLGSLSGTSPGIPAGLVIVPLNNDAYLSLTLNNPGFPVQGALGTLDAGGQGQAAFVLPPAAVSPTFAGLVVHHAYVVLDPTLAVIFASNPVPVTLTP